MPIDFTVTTSTSSCTGFLSASPASGTTSTTGDPAQVDLTVDTTNLTTPETCTGTLTLSAPASPTLTIPVTVNVSSTPLLDASPCVIDVSEIAGAAAPMQQAISLTSTDDTTPIDFTATVSTVPPGMTWLSLDLTSGSAPATINVTVNSGNLPAGTYMGSINLTSTTAGVLPQSIPVVLTVSSGTITVPTGALTFTMSSGGANPPSQTIEVSDIPAGAVVSAVATTDGSNFLTVTTSGATITASADGSQLTQGTYQGAVTILVPGASNSPFYVPVTLTIGPPAEFAPSPSSLNFTYQVGATLPAAQTIQIISASNETLQFTAMAVAPPGSNSGVVFLLVTPGGGTTPGSLSVSLDPSVVPTLPAGAYTNCITLTSADGSSQMIPVMLTISTAAPTIVSGASFQSGAVSPGEIVTIFGTQIGPAVPADLTLTASNMVATTLNDTTVTFNGVAAPLIFVSVNQINAIVPFEVATQTSVPVVITSNGVTSASFNVDVAPTNPALFAFSQTGAGPGAVLNQNGSLNASTNPAAAGSVIVVYATGEGITAPAAATGSVTASQGTSFPMPIGLVTITIGGIQAQILYAGEAPGLVAGVLQVNFVVPSGTPSGNQPIVLTVGGVSSPSTVTAAIQ